jgi:hypothetical protein
MPSKEARNKRAQQFRERAEQLRRIAEGMADYNSRETIQKIAADYARLALQAETLGNASDIPEPPGSFKQGA